MRKNKIPRNYGENLRHCSADSNVRREMVITMDADLQDSPDEIPELYRMITVDGYDLVSGWKQKRYDPLSKTIPTKLFNTVRAVSGIQPVMISTVDRRLYRKEVIKNIEVYGEMHCYIPLSGKKCRFPAR